MGSGFRYGPYTDGPDPLAPPYDVRVALDAIGDSVIEGARPGDALRELLRKGLPGTRDRRGLDELLRDIRDRQRQVRGQGRLDGTLERARALLDTAIGQERAELFPDPGDDARLREAELDALPADTAEAIRRLGSYEWRSPEARQTFDKLKDLLRQEVLDAQFQGLKQALETPDPAMMRRVKDMIAALNDMLEKDARGEHTQADFDAFMHRFGDLIEGNPHNLEELVDALARRAAAMDRLLNSLTPGQRDELSSLMAGALDEELRDSMSRLGEALRIRRPELSWGGEEQMSGNDPLSLSDATTALDELADLSQLESELMQDYAGARLDDIDEEAVRRALGRQAVDDLAELRRIEAELERQGYLRRNGGTVMFTPKALHRLGETALRRVFSTMDGARKGDHDQTDAGQAGDPTGATRPWRFGDEQPVDSVRTVRNALLRTASVRAGGGAVRLHVDDFEVAETERRTPAAVCLLVDLSYSMALRDTWGPAKRTALALHTLVTTKYPQDAMQIIGFSNYARVLKAADLAGLDLDMVQGTNLHHALLIAGRHLDRHPSFEPIVLVVTDGEPTAHLRRDGRSHFDWPPTRETLELTLSEVDKMTRRRATLNMFMLADDARLVSFVEEIARRNHGRVFNPAPDHLGEYVVRDYLRARRSRRR